MQIHSPATKGTSTYDTTRQRLYVPLKGTFLDVAEIPHRQPVHSEDGVLRVHDRNVNQPSRALKNTEKRKEIAMSTFSKVADKKYIQQMTVMAVIDKFTEEKIVFFVGDYVTVKFINAQDTEVTIEGRLKEIYSEFIVLDCSELFNEQNEDIPIEKITEMNEYVINS